MPGPLSSVAHGEESHWQCGTRRGKSLASLAVPLKGKCVIDFSFLNNRIEPEPHTETLDSSAPPSPCSSPLPPRSGRNAVACGTQARQLLPHMIFITERIAANPIRVFTDHCQVPISI